MQHTQKTTDKSASSLHERFNTICNSEEFTAKISKLVEKSTQIKRACFLSVSMQIESIDPLAILELYPNQHTFQFYWEKPERDYCLVASGSRKILESSGVHRFNKIEAELDHIRERHENISEIEHSAAGIHALGGFSFFDQVENDEIWEDFGSSRFVIPEWMIIKDGECEILNLCTFVCKNSTPDSIQKELESYIIRLEEVIRFYDEGNLTIDHLSINPQTVEISDANSEQEFLDWEEHINEAKRMIDNNYFDKIVLARKLKLTTVRKIKASLVVNRLRSDYPACTSFFIQFHDDVAFVGSTPELLASFKPNYILTEGLAGTIRRGKTASDDAILEKNLINSQKDQSEHKFVVDAICNQLSRFCHTIDRPDRPTVKKLANVQHLYTPITAWKNDGIKNMSVLHNMHPTPAVGGSPSGKAVKFIRSLENFERGWYAGPIGWMNLNKDGEFNVALRSGLILDNEAHLFAGCGIVTDSDPETEWKEANLKFIPMLSAINDA